MSFKKIIDLSQMLPTGVDPQAKFVLRNYYGSLSLNPF